MTLPGGKEVVSERVSSIAYNAVVCEQQQRLKQKSTRSFAIRCGDDIKGKASATL
jgi:hypothetical protein